MNVVVDASSLRRTPAGTQQWVHGIINALARQPDLRVTALLGPRRYGGGRPARLPNLLRQRWWFESGFRRAAARQGADALLMPANLSARRGPIPQIVTILDANFLTAPGTYERAVVRYATWAWGRSMRESDRITTISEYSRDELVRFFDVAPSKFDVVYPGLRMPAELSPRRSPHDVPYALYVGATERHKNVGVLLDAWNGRSPGGLDLAIVGRPGRDHEHVVRRASAMGRRVIVAGSVDDDRLEDWYRNASVFVFPSLTEGFGYPPLEAMARGVPVISSTGGSLPEVLGDAALFHQPTDAEAILALVTRVTQDPELRADLVARGRARAAGFTWRRAAEAMEETLRRVLTDVR